MEQTGAFPGTVEASLEDSRTQFVGSLGRRLETLRHALTQLEQAPGSAIHRDHVRRRIHAFGAAAGVLGFDRVFEAFREAEQVLGRGDAETTIGPREISVVNRAVDMVPSLVLGGDMPSGAPRARPPELSRGRFPTSVIVFGSQSLLESLTAAEDDSAFECERTEDVERAAEIVRVTAPDVAVIDSDRSGARDLVETLVHDPLLDPVRIVVVGTIERPDAAAALVALGALRVLPKPVSPESLRRAVSEAARGRASPVPRIEPIGPSTVEALTERLGQELRRGLLNAVRAQGRSVVVPMGDGTEILAAVWGSVARIRELVTERSGGAVRFEPYGPEGAIPLAPWTGDEHRRPPVRGERRGGDDIALSGRKVLVVDDDPSVVWFLGGLLRAAGAEVLEAEDGEEALHLARREWPEVIVSDVLMPGMDGFSLCREIKRDIALSDIPVILISWKEDLLQRVRELGAEAEGYLRKEASASAVVQRVREVLVPRVRVETRIASGHDARGRLDGLTPRFILEVACRDGRDASVEIRDAAFLYEVKIRGGRPRAAIRTTPEGRSEQGEQVLSALLGVRAGRFVVRADEGEVGGDWDEPLATRLSQPIERSRSALRALADLERVERVELDPEALEPYIAATPHVVRTIVKRLQDGLSPSEILAQGSSARVLETVLADLVQHGALLAITGADDADLWARAREDSVHSASLAEESRVARRRARADAPRPAPAIPSEPTLGEDSMFAGLSMDSLRPMEAPPDSQPAEPPPSSKGLAPPTSTPPEESPFEVALRSLRRPGEESGESSPEPDAAVPLPETRPGRKLPLPRRTERKDTPSGGLMPTPTPTLELGAAVMSLGGQEPPSEPARPPPKPAREPPPEKPLALTVKKSSPPEPEPRFSFDLEASAPPPVAASLADAFEPLPSTEPDRPARPLELRNVKPEGAESAIPLVTHSSPPAIKVVEDDEAPVPLVGARAQDSGEGPEPRDTLPPKRQAPAAKASASPPAKAESWVRAAAAPAIVVTVAALSAFALVSALRGSPPRQPSSEPAAAARAAVAEEEPTEPADPSAEAVPPSETSAEPSATPGPSASATVTKGLAVETGLPLPEGIAVSAGRGLLEVEIDAPYAILVDGVVVGTGPLRRIPLRPGSHEVRIITGRGKNVDATLEVVADRRSRISGTAVQ